MSTASHGTHADSSAPGDEPRATVLVYSDNVHTRTRVRTAIGRRASADGPRVTWVECATEPAVIERVRGGGLDLVILDGEAAPAGGMGVCLTLKEEIYQCPPVLVLTGRVVDNWLAAWSRADAAVAHPLDPLILADTVAALLRGDAAASPRPATASAVVPAPTLQDPAAPGAR